MTAEPKKRNGDSYIMKCKVCGHREVFADWGGRAMNDEPSVSVWIVEWRFRPFVPVNDNSYIWSSWEVYPSGFPTYERPEVPVSDDFTEYRAAEYRRIDSKD